MTDIAGLCERLRATGLQSGADAADTLERQAAELASCRQHWSGEFKKLSTESKALAEEQAAEIERMREALRNIQSEAEREEGRWVHLKRVIAVNARAALTGEDFPQPPNNERTG